MKYTVTLPTPRKESATISEVNPLRNAFAIMMASQRAIDMAKLPPKVNERNKDKLFNDLVSFLESKQWVWSTGGVSRSTIYNATPT